MEKDREAISESFDMRQKAETNLSHISVGMYKSSADESRRTAIGDGRRLVPLSRVFVAVILDSVRFIVSFSDKLNEGPGTAIPVAS
jgi:hypothetical protein